MRDDDPKLKKVVDAADGLSLGISIVVAILIGVAIGIGLAHRRELDALDRGVRRCGCGDPERLQSLQGPEGFAR